METIPDRQPLLPASDLVWHGDTHLVQHQHHQVLRHQAGPLHLLSDGETGHHPGSDIRQSGESQVQQENSLHQHHSNILIILAWTR